MTSRFDLMTLYMARHMRIPKIEHDKHNSRETDRDSNQILLSDKDRLVLIVSCRIGGKVCYLQLPCCVGAGR